jgi:hypothetical protein
MRRTYKKQSRRYKRSHKRSNTRRHICRHRQRMIRGGDYSQATVRTVEGVPVIEDTTVVVPGLGPISLRELNDHKERQYLHGMRP